MDTQIKRFIPSRKRHRTLVLAAVAVGAAACASDGDLGSENDDPVSEEQLAEQQHALEADRCKDVLMNGVFNEVRTSANGADAFALAQASCREESNNATASGSVGFLGFGANGGGSAASFDKFCQSYNKSMSSEEATSLLTRTASPAIVAAWADCMTARGGLQCYTDPGDPAIGLTYKDPNHLGDLVGSSIQLTNMTMAKRTQELAVPTLGFGTTQLTFSVPAPASDSLFVFNGKTANTREAMSCKVSIKSPRTIRLGMGKPWTDLAVMYRDLAAAVDGVTAGAPGEQEIGAYNAFVIRYWGAAVKSNECTTDDANANVNCTTPPIAKDYNFSFTFPGLRCGAQVKMEPHKVNGNALSMAPSTIAALVRTMNAAAKVTRIAAKPCALTAFGGS